MILSAFENRLEAGLV